MDLRCLFSHRWAGCRCARCGRVRDEDHQWGIVDCRRKCCQCGLVRGVTHDWQGCFCRRCGAENHHWLDGVCAQCGERCSHPETITSWDSQVFHRQGQASRACQRCGRRVD